VREWLDCNDTNVPVGIEDDHAPVQGTEGCAAVVGCCGSSGLDDVVVESIDEYTSDKVVYPSRVPLIWGQSTLKDPIVMALHSPTSTRVAFSEQYESKYTDTGLYVSQIVANGSRSRTLVTGAADIDHGCNDAVGASDRTTLPIPSFGICLHSTGAPITAIASIESNGCCGSEDGSPL